MAEAGHCLFEFHRTLSDGLGGLASNAFFAGPSPRGTWVDHSVFTSLWRLIGWDQLGGNALPGLVTVMLAMAAAGVTYCGWTTIASITHQA